MLVSTNIMNQIIANSLLLYSCSHWYSMHAEYIMCVSETFLDKNDWWTTQRWDAGSSQTLFIIFYLKLYIYYPSALFMPAIKYDINTFHHLFALHYEKRSCNTRPSSLKNKMFQIFLLMPSNNLLILL